MPHVDLLYAKLQKKNIDSVHIRGSIQQFQQDIQKISSEGGSQPKKRRSLSPEVHERIAAEQLKGECGVNPTHNRIRLGEPLLVSRRTHHRPTANQSATPLFPPATDVTKGTHSLNQSNASTLAELEQILLSN